MKENKVKNTQKYDNNSIAAICFLSCAVIICFAMFISWTTFYIENHEPKKTQVEHSLAFSNGSHILIEPISANSKGGSR